MADTYDEKGRGQGEKKQVTGGGEFSEGGGPGRTSETMGNKKGGFESTSSGKAGRYTLDCGESGEGCSLKLSGSYDEVVAAGVEHGRSAHGMQGDESKIREDIKGYIKEDKGAGSPGQYQGRGQSQAGRSPGLPS